MAISNEIRVDFPSLSVNEAFARMVISAFILPLDPTVEELADVKTAVSEAVTNAIVHGYPERRGTVRMHAFIYDNCSLRIDVIDNGCGIADIERARQPFYSTLSHEERSGMGFTIIESFMDNTQIISEPGKGTTIRMSKQLGAQSMELKDVREG
ncbi:MAG: anti-sigma F factor [Clostridia bacterium]|nr:anti-sigma F factor [Clostridia bacterium]